MRLILNQNSDESFEFHFGGPKQLDLCEARSIIVRMMDEATDALMRGYQKISPIITLPSWHGYKIEASLYEADKSI